MLSLILTMTMMSTQPAATTAQVQTCQWPHRCVETTTQTAQVQPCVWPNRCAETPAAAALAFDPEIAQVQTCQWPHTCASNS